MAEPARACYVLRSKMVIRHLRQHGEGSSIYYNFDFAAFFVYFESYIYVFVGLKPLGYIVQWRHWPCWHFMKHTWYVILWLFPLDARLYYILSPVPTDVCREHSWMLAGSPHKFIFKSIYMLRKVSIRNISTRRFWKKMLASSGIYVHSWTKRSLTNGNEEGNKTEIVNIFLENVILLRTLASKLLSNPKIAAIS